MRKKLPIQVLLIIMYILYFYSIQRFLAKKTFNEYIQLQGTTEENIKSKRIFKDYKQGGYFIEVIYKDDPDFIYDYKYSVDAIKNMTNYKAIRCDVYAKYNEAVELSGDVENIKYPPIE